MNYLNKEIIKGQKLETLAPREVKWKGSSTFGIRGLNQTGLALHDKLLERHILCLGAIGSGKSVTLYHIINAIRKNATENDVFIFFDAKGDYLQEFYQEGDMVISNHIDPPPGTVYWNIYKEILFTEKEKRQDVIREIAATIFKEDIEASSTPVFATGARDLFAAILSCQISDIEEKGGECDHAQLMNWLGTADGDTIRQLLERREGLQWIRSYVDEQSSTSTVFSFLIHLYQTLFNVFSGGFSKKGDFSIKEALLNKGGKAVFLEYDLANANILRLVYTLLLDLAMKDVLGRSSSKGNIYFILDEFPLIPKLNYIDSALNFGRSLGVKVIAGVQNFGQIENTYGNSLANSIISGFGTVFTFRLFDEISRKIIATRHGRNRESISIRSSNANKGVQDTISEGSCIEDWDFVNLEVGQCIVSPFNGNPFLFYPIMYEGR